MQANILLRVGDGIRREKDGANAVRFELDNDYNGDSCVPEEAMKSLSARFPTVRLTVDYWRVNALYEVDFRWKALTVGFEGGCKTFDCLISPHEGKLLYTDFLARVCPEWHALTRKEKAKHAQQLEKHEQQSVQQEEP